MTQLEAVYLANVVLYVESIKTIIKLVNVNKKCQEATKILRYYQTKKIEEGEDDDYFDYVVVRNVFDLFPNIETINCGDEDIRDNPELFERVKRIELNLITFYSNKINLSQEIKDKVIKLDIYCDSLKNIRLSDFPNARKVIVNYYNCGYLKGFLGENNVRLDLLILEVKDDVELDCLKDYRNIASIIIQMKDKITIERYQQLKLFATVCTQYPIDGVDVTDTLGVYRSITLNDKIDINKTYDLTLFTYCYVESDCDLRNCELLEGINTQYNEMNRQTLQIKGLNHLERISNIKGVDCIPSSVTYLSVSPYFNYKELLDDDKDCFINIKEINLHFNWEDNNLESTIFMNFQNCTTLRLSNRGVENGFYEFPRNIEDLTIDYCDNVDQLGEISKLPKLKSLTINFGTIKDVKQIQKMYNELKQLEKLETNYVDAIVLPSSVTQLEFKVEQNTDLSQYTHLKVIRINCYSEGKTIQLPNNLKKVIIYGDVSVTNSDEIDVDQVILQNTKSQFCKWKSKKVFIQQEYGSRSE